MNCASRLSSHLSAGPRSVIPIRSVSRLQALQPAFCRLFSAPKCPGRGHAVVLASFLPDAVDNVITTSTLIGAGLAILGSAALALRVDPLPPSAQRQKQDEEGFEYGLMGFVSFFPLVNWTAWVLPAITHPERAALYYSLAALYAVPLIRNGFDLDGYVWAMWALMIVHTQVERIAQTEPQTLRDMTLVSGLLRGVASLIGKSGGFLSSLFGIVAEDSVKVVRGGSNPADPGAQQQQQDPAAGKFLPREGEGHVSVDDLQLKEFDRQLLERERRRKMQQQQEGQEQGRGRGKE